MRPKFVGLYFVRLWVLALAIAPAAATAGDLSADFTVATDYVLRGYSRTGFEPALQAGLSYRHRSGFVAGIWGSTVRLPDGYADDTELRAFAGYSRSLGQGWGGSAVLVRYEHPGADSQMDISYTEASVSVQYRELLSVTVSYSPRVFGSEFSALYTEVSGRYPLSADLELSAGIGLADLGFPFDLDYVYGHAGLGRSFGRFHIDVGYYSSDAFAVPIWGEAVDGRWVLRLSTRIR